MSRKQLEDQRAAFSRPGSLFDLQWSVGHPGAGLIKPHRKQQDVIKDESLLVSLKPVLTNNFGANFNPLINLRIKKIIEKAKIQTFQKFNKHKDSPNWKRER